MTDHEITARLNQINAGGFDNYLANDDDDDYQKFLENELADSYLLDCDL